MFLLSQVFLIVNHSPLVQKLTSIILFENNEVLFNTTPEQWFYQFQLGYLRNKQNSENDSVVESNSTNTTENNSNSQKHSSISSDSDLNITDEEKEKLLALGD